MFYRADQTKYYVCALLAAERKIVKGNMSRAARETSIFLLSHCPYTVQCSSSVYRNKGLEKLEQKKYLHTKFLLCSSKSCLELKKKSNEALNVCSCICTVLADNPVKLPRKTYLATFQFQCKVRYTH